ncbi:MAG: hypothetical protein ACREIC_08335, partial [Limisphaerales bacterium]
FEVFLLDTTTGLDVPNSTSGPLLFTWIDVPDGRPTLSIAPDMTISWPASTATNYVLEAADSPFGSPWSSVTNNPFLQAGEWMVVLEPGEPRKFFRMRLAP